MSALFLYIDIKYAYVLINDQNYNSLKVVRLRIESDQLQRSKPTPSPVLTSLQAAWLRRWWWFYWSLGGSSSFWFWDLRSVWSRALKVCVSVSLQDSLVVLDAEVPEWRLHAASCVHHLCSRLADVSRAAFIRWASSRWTSWSAGQDVLWVR